MSHSTTQTTTTSPAPTNQPAPTPLQAAAYDILHTNLSPQTIANTHNLTADALLSILNHPHFAALQANLDLESTRSAARALLNLIFATLAAAAALAENPNATQEQRRRVGTLNASIQRSHKALQLIHTILPHTLPAALTTPKSKGESKGSNTTTPKIPNIKAPTPTPTPTTTPSTTSPKPATTPSISTPTHKPTPSPKVTNCRHHTEHPLWPEVLPLLTPAQLNISTAINTNLLISTLNFSPDLVPAYLTALLENGIPPEHANPNTPHHTQHLAETAA